MRVTNGACLLSNLLKSSKYCSHKPLTVSPGHFTNALFPKSLRKLSMSILWYLLKVTTFALCEGGLTESSWARTRAWSEINSATRTLEMTLASVGVRTRSRIWPCRWVAVWTFCVILYDSKQFWNLILSFEEVSTWILKSPQIRKEGETEDKYSKRLRNWSRKLSEHEPGGR